MCAKTVDQIEHSSVNLAGLRDHQLHLCVGAQDVEAIDPVATLALWVSNILIDNFKHSVATYP